MAHAVQGTPRMSRRPILDRAFTSVMLELGRLHDEHVDFAEWTRQLLRVDRALTRLCDALLDALAPYAGVGDAEVICA